MRSPAGALTHKILEFESRALGAEEVEKLYESAKAPNEKYPG
jgi:hypothetical protein